MSAVAVLTNPTAARALAETAARAAARTPAAMATIARAARTRWKALAFLVLGALLASEIVIAAPYVGRAMSALDRPDLWWVGLAVAAQLISMGAFARVQRRMLSAAGARVPMHRMAALYFAANAVTVTFPGGTALSSGYVFKRLRSWGATVPAAGFTILASAVLSVLSFAVFAVAGAALAGNGGLGSLLVIAGAGVAVAVALLIRRRNDPGLVLRLAGRGLPRINRILHRAPDTGLAGLRRAAADLAAIKPRNTDWLAGLGLATLNWLADLACLVAACRATGADATLVLVMVSYLAGTGAAGLSPLPGGLGAVDAAMIFALTQGGLTAVPATAGVLLYRLISFALVVALGWLILATTWLADRRRLGSGAALGRVASP